MNEEYEWIEKEQDRVRGTAPEGKYSEFVDATWVQSSHPSSLHIPDPGSKSIRDLWIVSVYEI